MWDDFVRRLDSYPPGTDTFLPPCSEERLQAVESELGRLPAGIIDMLKHFNGANLFKCPGQLVAVFGISTIPPLPAFEWGVDTYIDKFTPLWRAAGENRQNDWAIAMMNYGGLVIVDAAERVREWDTAVGEWDPRSFDGLAEWAEDILSEGDAFLKEE
jgi:hypothetical protein